MAKYSISADRCDCNVIHEDIVKKVQNKVPEDELLFNLAELFKVFGDSTRIRIISALLHSQMCVCDIAALLGMTKSSVSHQLRLLRQTKLVKYRRDGKVVFYSLDDKHIAGIFKMGLAHISEDKQSKKKLNAAQIAPVKPQKKRPVQAGLTNCAWVWELHYSRRGLFFYFFR